MPPPQCLAIINYHLNTFTLKFPDLNIILLVPGQTKGLEKSRNNLIGIHLKMFCAYRYFKWIRYKIFNGVHELFEYKILIIFIFMNAAYLLTTDLHNYTFIPVND